MILSSKETNKNVEIMMNFISFCDGKTSLLEIAESINLPIWQLYEIVDLLKSHNLIEEN